MNRNRTSAGICPTADSLSSYLNDRLSVAEGTDLESHIQECEHCHRALESLTPYSWGEQSHPARRSEFRPADDFLEELYAGVSAEIAVPLVDPPLPVVPGFEVVRVIGRGGMGVVYQATDTRLQRTVALKVLHPFISVESGGSRLRREAEALARLRHPNVIQIYEVGEADGRQFLSLEYVDGPNLQMAFATDPPTARRAAELVEKLANATHAAHRAGIIHRDLKPSNVLISRDGDPKIADFGLAKLVDRSNEGVTHSGQLLGTPGYAAPEQISTAGDGVSASADIYALGAILYYLLTGRPPFRSDSTLETLLHVLRDPPVPPIRLNPAIPRDLETICLACLQKYPAKRYATANALADDLRRFLDGRPVKARPITLFGRSLRWARRNPAAAGLVGLAASFMATLVVGAAWQWREAERRAAVEQAARMDAELRAKAETEARGAAEGRVAELAVDHGLNLCSQGSVGPGLVALADAVAKADPDSDSVRVARLNIDAWQHHVAGRRHSFAHPDAVTAVAFSLDGRSLATGCRDGMVRRFDTASGRLIGAPLSQPKVFAAEFLPDNEWVVAAGRDGTVRVLEFTTGLPVGDPIHHGGSINAMALDPVRKVIATAGNDGKVRLWEAATGRNVHSLEHGSPVLSLAFSPDGKRLVTGAEDRKVRSWDAQTGDAVGTTTTHGAAVDEVAAGPHGMTAAGSKWGLSTRLPLTFLDTSKTSGFSTTGSVSAVAFDPNGRYMAVALGDGDKSRGISLYRIEGAEVSVRMLPFEAVARKVIVSRSGRQMLAAGEGCPPVLWSEVADRPAKVTFSESSDGPVTLSQEGNRAATSRRNRIGSGWTVTLWDIPRSADALASIDQKSVDRIDMGPDGTALLSGGRKARLWNTATGQPAAPAWSSGPVVACTWGERPLAWVVERSLLHAFDAKTGKPAQPPIELPGSVRVLDIAFDGRFAAASVGDEVVLLDLTARREVARIPVGESVSSLDFAPDGLSLAIGNAAGSVQVRSTSDRSMLVEIPSRGSGVTKLSFGPDGRMLAVSYDDKSVVVWDSSISGLIGQPMAHASTPQQSVWSPDGTILITVDASSTARLWDSRTGIQIGPALPRTISAVAVDQVGRRLLTSDPLREVRTWEMPRRIDCPTSELPEWVRRLVSR